MYDPGRAGTLEFFAATSTFASFEGRRPFAGRGTEGMAGKVPAAPGEIGGAPLDEHHPGVIQE